MTPIKSYLINGNLPDSKAQARKIRLRALRYEVVDGELYRKSYLMPLLRCLGAGEAHAVLEDIHSGLCGSHIGHRNLARKAILAGFYWPTMFKDSEDVVRRCRQCQVHAPINRQPATELATMSSPWPFAQWGIDLLGPFPKAPGGYQFLVVAIDYFSKWIEVEPLASITSKVVAKFFWRQLICRYGIPYAVVSDNGRQFQAQFAELCESLGIAQKFTSVGHPQANGQVEVTNRILLHGIKTRLETTGESWVDALPSVVWGYRTTAKVSTGETPFSLTFGCEAMIPSEIRTPTLRVHVFDEEVNAKNQLLALDKIEETREQAALKQARYKQLMRRYHDRKLRARKFFPGDLVLRKNDVSRAVKEGKLAPNWEGPYRVITAHGAGSYSLADMKGQNIPRAWNVDNLRRFFA